MTRYLLNGLELGLPDWTVGKPGELYAARVYAYRMSTWAPYEFRRATNQDTAAIWSLISSVLAGYGIVVCPRTTDSDLTDIERNYWDVAGAFYVLLDPDQVIGTVALHPICTRVCELCRMYLSVNHRRHGLGRRLLEAALEQARARGYEEVLLETAAVLTEAIALYESAGFALDQRLPSGRNCDLVMSLRLGPNRRG